MSNELFTRLVTMTTVLVAFALLVLGNPVDQALAAPMSGTAPESRAAMGPPAGFHEGVWITKCPGNYACFKLETPGGIRIVVDPYAMDETIAPDIVTESHQDFDHNDTSRLTGSFTVLTKPGEWVVKGIRIIGVPGKHNKPDSKMTNVMFAFEIEGLKIAHLASQGAPLDDQTVARLQGVDVLMIQGFEPQGFAPEFLREQKLTGEECRRIIDRLHPRIVIPEHGTPRIGEYFAKRLGSKVEYAPAEGIVVIKKDLEGVTVPRVVDMDRKESSR